MQNNTYHSFYSTTIELDRIEANKRRIDKIMARVFMQILAVVVVLILSLLGVALYNS